MKTTLYIIFGILFAIVAFYWETWWTSWVIKELFHKVYNSWAIFGFLVMIAFLTPFIILNPMSNEYVYISHQY